LPSDLTAETTVRWPTPVPLPDAQWWEQQLRAAFSAHVALVPALSGRASLRFPHGNRLPVPLEHGEQLSYRDPRAENLVDLCRYYLDHDENRAALVERSRDYFDRYLHYCQLGAYYLSVIYDQLGVVDGDAEGSARAGGLVPTER
jgi:hypothetical protein